MLQHYDAGELASGIWDGIKTGESMHSMAGYTDAMVDNMVPFGLGRFMPNIANMCNKYAREGYRVGEVTAFVEDVIGVAAAASKLKGAGALGQADDVVDETLDTSYEIQKRAKKGADGATSYNIHERVNGDYNSRIHSVIKDGEFIHQHQTHVGKYGGERIFPDEWTGVVTIGVGGIN